jgi:hypothetical protein
MILGANYKVDIDDAETKIPDKKGRPKDDLIDAALRQLL